MVNECLPVLTMFYQSVRMFDATEMYPVIV